MPIPTSQSTDYHAYLLRLWRDSPQEGWRASLYSSITGTRHYFADTAQLIAFLQARTDINYATDYANNIETGEPGEVE